MSSFRGGRGGRGGYAGSANVSVPAGGINAASSSPSGGQKGLYDTLVKTGIEKRMDKNEKELDDLRAQLAKLEALKKQKDVEAGVVEPTAIEGSSSGGGDKKEEKKKIIFEHEAENIVDILLDDIFAEMFEEMKGYRPTKAEILAFKSTQTDDYDAELEEFEQEAYGEDGDDYYPDYEDEYAYEEAERQRLLREMLEAEEGFDVTTHNAVFFDQVDSMMGELSVKEGGAGSSAAEGKTGFEGEMGGVAVEEDEEKKAAVANFKLNAAAKEWKPPGAE